MLRTLPSGLPASNGVFRDFSSKLASRRLRPRLTGAKPPRCSRRSGRGCRHARLARQSVEGGRPGVGSGRLRWRAPTNRQDRQRSRCRRSVRSDYLAQRGRRPRVLHEVNVASQGIRCCARPPSAAQLRRLNDRSQAVRSGRRETAVGRVLPAGFPIELPGSSRRKYCYSNRATAQSAARCAG